MNPEPKFICNRIADKTCMQTSNCCPHRIPHRMEENMACSSESHECRFAPGNECICIPHFKQEIEGEFIPLEEAAKMLNIPVSDPSMVPKQQPVEIIPPFHDTIVIEGDGKLLSVQNMETKPVKKHTGGRRKKV